MAHDRYLEMAALRSLDLLEGAEAEEFDRHIGEGCESCQAELASMREAAGSIALTAVAHDPPPHVRERLFGRMRNGPQVWKSWDASLVRELHVVRAGEGEWQTVKDGVYAKQLYVDVEHDRVTMLVRMDPGASYVPHRHAAPEQCLVLEGDIREGDDVFRAGDFQCVAPGSTHGAQTTESGCLLLIVSSLHDELIGH
jgi:quercetin dioxygenase-like cupin family protein